jgi:hypothetical protein
MTNLQELIDTANKLSERLEMAANDEKRFSIDLQLHFERMSWQALCWANDLQEIKSYSGIQV